MALTADVKEELARVEVSKTSVRAAELAAVLRFAGGLHIISSRIAIEAELDSPHDRTPGDARPRRALRRATRRLGDLAVGNPADEPVPRARARRRRDPRTPDRPARRPPPSGPRAAQQAHHRVARRASPRSGAARSSRSGSLTDPGRSAALEVTCPGNETAMALVGAAGRLGISAKAREVRGVHRVVIRDGEAISAMLAIMGATDDRAQLGGAPPASRGARHRQPPRELRRRQPATLGPGRGRRVRARRARAWSSSATTSPTT